MGEIELDERTCDAEDRDRPVLVMVADDNPAVRELVAVVIADSCEVAVIEAEDGAHAVQLGLQLRPQIGVLDLHMPRLDGIRAAETLRGLLPSMQLALHSSDPTSLHERGRHLGLPLFDKLELDAIAAWVAGQLGSHRPCATKLDLVCASCGYGILTPMPAPRCPLCQADDPWIARQQRFAAPLDADGTATGRASTTTRAPRRVSGVGVRR